MRKIMKQKVESIAEAKTRAINAVNEKMLDMTSFLGLSSPLINNHADEAEQEEAEEQEEEVKSETMSKNKQRAIKKVSQTPIKSSIVKTKTEKQAKSKY